MDDGRFWKWGSRGKADIEQATDRHSLDFPRCRHVDALPLDIPGAYEFLAFSFVPSLRQKQGTGEIAEVTPSLRRKQSPLSLALSSSLGRFLCGWKN